jgi:hypothetical protein
MQMSLTEAAVAMALDKGQGVAALRHAVLAVADFGRLFGCVRESCFKVKKLPNGIKDFKTVRNDGQN